jgi:catalase
MNTLYGAHPGVRANHATGAVFEGTFTGAVKSATRVLKKI